VYWALGNLSRGGDTQAAPFLEALGRGGAFAPLAHLQACVAGGVAAGVPGAEARLGVASEICWLLTYLTAREPEAVEALLGAGLCDALVAALGVVVNTPQATRELFGLATPALRTCGNVLAGPDAWAPGVLRNSAGLDFAQVLTWALGLAGAAATNALALEALWVVGNLCLLRAPETAPALFAELTRPGGALAACVAMVAFSDAVLRFGAAALTKEALGALRNLAANPAAPPDLLGALVAGAGDGGRDFTAALTERLRRRGDVEELHICVFLLGFCMEKVRVRVRVGRGVRLLG